MPLHLCRITRAFCEAGQLRMHMPEYHRFSQIPPELALIWQLTALVT